MAKSPKRNPVKKAGKGKPVKKPRKANGVAEPELPETAPPLAIGPGSSVLDRLFAVVTERRDADPNVSHSARLLSRGMTKVAQKFGEESVECLIEAVAGNREALVAESADVLYHLIVLWVASGVHPEQVWTELRRREGVSGIVEKASRPRKLAAIAGVQTTKIP